MEKVLDREKVDPEIINLIKKYIKPLPIRAIYLFGSSTLSPEEQEEQDTEKYMHVQSPEERDKDIWVQLDIEYNPDLMDEIHAHWENSDEFQELQEMGYDVRLAAKDEAVHEPNILLTGEVL